jgi:hypothetical protein
MPGVYEESITVLLIRPGLLPTQETAPVAVYKDQYPNSCRHIYTWLVEQLLFLTNYFLCDFTT